MQIKKSEIEETILLCAKDEFVLHGYENASMRTIAKKANTSLGNIYHYFPNKKAILDNLLQPIIININDFLQAHIEADIKITDLSEINEILEEMDFDEYDLKSVISKEFVILMETKDPDYTLEREKLLYVFRTHIADHMRCNDPNNHFVMIVTKMITDCIIHLVRCGECTKNKKREIIDMFAMLCRCVAVHDLAEEEEKSKKLK